MAVTGKSALRVALESPPDAIILDVDLPDTDGYTLCRAMRRTSTLRTVPIVMLTALSDKRNEIAGLRAGADDYLTKPIDTERLQARLENALSRNIRELDANPLTHLPGNTSILQEMERRLRKQESFAVIYSDLNNFKAFNDRYGFLRGDQAIKLAAQCIVLSVEGRAAQSVVMTGNWFIGHVGGDDFVVILPAEKAEDVSREIIKRFDAAIPALYDPEDRDRGYIEGKSRQGEPAHFPFVGHCFGHCVQPRAAFYSPRRNQFHGHGTEKLRQILRKKRFCDGPPGPAHRQRGGSGSRNTIQEWGRAVYPAGHF
jgi:diguanylate cyclase (GGDEF)-like protein